MNKSGDGFDNSSDNNHSRFPSPKSMNNSNILNPYTSR